MTFRFRYRRSYTGRNHGQWVVITWDAEGRPHYRPWRWWAPWHLWLRARDWLIIRRHF